MTDTAKVTHDQLAHIWHLTGLPADALPNAKLDITAPTCHRRIMSPRLQPPQSPLQDWPHLNSGACALAAKRKPSALTRATPKPNS